MMMVILRYTDGRLTVTIPADDVEAFAVSWPCFGDVQDDTKITADFAPNGDLEDLDGDGGFDERGVLALLEDVKAYGFGCVTKLRCRHIDRPDMARVAKYLDDCRALGIEPVPASAWN